MHHRKVFQVILSLLALAYVAGCAVPSASEPVKATLSDSEAYVLANRLSWGATPGLVKHMQQVGYKNYLYEELHPATEPQLPAEVATQIASITANRKHLPEVVQELEQRRKDIDSKTDPDDKKAAQQALQAEMTRMARESATRHVLRALYSPSQVREKMVWFWINHFNIFQGKANLRVLVGDYEESAIRPNALGKFRDLLGAVIKHPAMLRYLDNEQNAAGRINENLARELMELHTLGVDGGYTQHDVQEMARVLTGVGISHNANPAGMRRELKSYYVRQGLFEFHPARHDFAAKELLGKPIRSQGLDELEEALDRLAAHPSTARFVSRKLATWWLNDEPSKALVKAMSDEFLHSGGDIAGTLGVLFSSSEFVNAKPKKFKDPMHYVMSAVRMAYEDKPILNAGPILSWLNRMGEPLYGHPTPDGYPLNSSAWTGSSQMTTRFEIAKAIGTGNAGLFRTEGPQPLVRPAFPQLANALYYQSIKLTLSPATLSALDQANSPQEWNIFLLSSPEMMLR